MDRTSATQSLQIIRLLEMELGKVINLSLVRDYLNFIRGDTSIVYGDHLCEDSKGKFFPLKTTYKGSLRPRALGTVNQGKVLVGFTGMSGLEKTWEDMVMRKEEREVSRYDPNL